MHETENDVKKLSKALQKTRHNFIRYESLRHANVPRQFGIPHPESYIAQCLVIKRLWSEIKQHCAKPKVPVSRIHVQKTSGNQVFLMNYQKRRFEKQKKDIHDMLGARFVVDADISTCFPSIYTHSIPWALHGHQKAKTDKTLSLSGNLLDRATQGTRDGQTNGLTVGPPASNIISEIVLTCVDANLVDNGYERFSRHIDDYKFYAKSYEEAERFIRDLAVYLREYELTLNAKKTQITPMPQSVEERWVRELNGFQMPTTGDVNFRTINSFLDLALDLAGTAGTSAVLNYAIQMVPDRLSGQAKELFVQRVINLSLMYPYLAPLLGIHVFDKHVFQGIDTYIGEFIELLLEVGVEMLHPDAIAHALYYTLKYGLRLGKKSEARFREIIDLDDCLCDVLLFEYAKLYRIKQVQTDIRKRTNRLKLMDNRERDRFWLLIYQLWDEADLAGNGQTFLAELKRQRFAFVEV